MPIDAKLLKSKMALKEFNIDSLASETGLNRDTISNIINGKNFPSYTAINAIYYALKLTPEEGMQIFFARDLRKTKV
ncbi:helix-turn-helix transcriptional regulator [Mammaliicoccus fleurettii]|uniref:Helix-turn-helix transcriptional regulator n=1 Tax=Mammaliicoccus fleurettii TaxID=150056 RepID=A0ABS5ML04_9STAP|nr:helix-turn-helix transcriptional regulator [Mammaliicoccus fleurettii]MBL0846566.1 helix-turn-helix transcriptional regulator [Mammaliicoccus fleurettii]MBS3671007.1 helix-turn-helix transcriptional regulator [Mammaliicoccus fleurettii]MBS3696066.1 helix-turn-helix transcriptional regulator [Mammaliicoccus fleurettii]MEB7779226.1 helix-turn-helix domain-containing protein [Mammaliicoccus fleurettii]